MEENIIKKIKKLMAIAEDPNASENEVFVATKNAHKLMAKHNITNEQVMKDQNNNEIITCIMDICPKFYLSIINEIGTEFRCEVIYTPRRNRITPKFVGFKSDTVVAETVWFSIHKFLDKELPKYIKEMKDLEYGTDARVLKRSYCNGFAVELQNRFEQNKIELRKEYKNELIVLNVPKEVTNYLTQTVKPKFVKTQELEIDPLAFSAGTEACNKFYGSKRLEENQFER